MSYPKTEAWCSSNDQDDIAGLNGGRKHTLVNTYTKPYVLPATGVWHDVALKTYSKHKGTT